MNLIEQTLNILQNGDKGGQMNLEQVRGEILKHHSEEKKKKAQQKENEELIKKLFFDVVKVSGSAAVKQAIDELIADFNKGN